MKQPGPFLLAIEELSRARVLTQIWNVLEIIAQRWADRSQIELPLVIWGCAVNGRPRRLAHHHDAAHHPDRPPTKQPHRRCSSGFSPKDSHNRRSGSR